MKTPNSIICLVLFLGLLIKSKPVSSASLESGFYGSTCPLVEIIVRKVVTNAILQDPGVGAGLIRMHFHDCFVRGCDASILLDSTPGNPAEKDSVVNNPSLRQKAFELIDQAKAEIEAACPQTVSCADILAFAARDSTCSLGGISYAVPAGRRDGRVSLKDEPIQNLPGPSLNLSQLQGNFARKGLSVDDVVTLSGAHSVGRSHCSSFSTRLYSFNTTTSQDPSLDPNFANDLKTKCPSPTNNPNPTVPLDFSSPYRLDTNYYRNLQYSRGLLTSDQTLMSSPSTVGMVTNLARDGRVWADKFASAMVRMGLIEVLTGNDGEIRKNCRVVN